VLVRILGVVVGEEFPAVLAAAQHGSEAAFTRLWLDANPALVRYLRVIAPESAEDVAADAWVQVVRGLRRFRGDEAAWRAWLFTTARRRAIDASRRRSRRREEPLHDVPGAEPGLVADVLAALTARTARDELTGLTAAQAEFRRHVVLPLQAKRSPRRRPGGPAPRLCANSRSGDRDQGRDEHRPIRPM
jgi:RNA polymerase sigma-70 factor, ECF subfamily